MSMRRVFSCVVRRGCFLWLVRPLSKTVSLCLASFCTPRPNLPVTTRASGFHTFAFQSTIMKRTSFLGVSSKRSCRLCYRTMKFYRVILNSMSNCYQVWIDLVISFIFIISVNNFCYMNLILSVSLWSWSLYLITTTENLTICSLLCYSSFNTSVGLQMEANFKSWW